MPATPREIIEKVAGIEQAGTDRTVARLLGSGGMVRTSVPKGKADAVDKMLRCLLATERLRWHSGAALKAVPATGEPGSDRPRLSRSPDEQAAADGAAGRRRADQGPGLLVRRSRRRPDLPGRSSDRDRAEVGGYGADGAWRR